MNRRIPRGAAIAGLAALGVAAVALSLVTGPTSLDKVDRTILLGLRLPHALLAFLVGMSLSASGVVFQGLFRNPLADPFVVGVSGGAALGAVGMIVSGVEGTFWRLGAAFAGGLGAVFLAWGLARRGGRVPLGSLLLAGFAVGLFTGALVSLLFLFNGRNWTEIMGWMMGNLHHADPWNRVRVMVPVVGVSLGAMSLYTRDLNLMLLGEETAGQLGVDAERVKKVLLVAGAGAAAAAVATCGIIGFVGLIVPHAVRKLVGPDHRTLLPAAALGGGVFLVLVDAGAKAVSPDTPLPIGSVTALCGVPFFLWMLRQRSS